MAGDPDAPILAGCYYPDCHEEHHPKSKFCPVHGGPPVKTSSPPANWAARARLKDDGTYEIERRDR